MRPFILPAMLRTALLAGAVLFVQSALHAADAPSMVSKVFGKASAEAQIASLNAAARRGLMLHVNTRTWSGETLR